MTSSTTVQELIDHQDGVVSRRQLLEAGAVDGDIRRWVRRRELTRIHAGVYVGHTGPLAWSSRAWAAVLFSWPAALAAESALQVSGGPAHGGTGPGDEVIQVAIDASRTATRLPGVRVHRLVRLEERVLWNRSPPRVRLEDALLAVAGRSRHRADALAVVSDACRGRLTTPARLADELTRHPNLLHRRWLLGVLQEAADGVQSLLVGSYRRRVEQAHGLPAADRQHRERTADGVVYRDTRYRRFALVVELDGRVGHELSRDRWDDQDRDLLAATGATLTIRLGWRHTEVTPCRTAARLAVVMHSRGWRGTPRRCGPGCTLTTLERCGLPVT